MIQTHQETPRGGETMNMFNVPNTDYSITFTEHINVDVGKERQQLPVKYVHCPGSQLHSMTEREAEEEEEGNNRAVVPPHHCRHRSSPAT